MRELHSNWKEVKLGNICTLISDGLHGTPKYDNNGNYYFINGNNLCNGKIVIKNDTKKVNEIEYNKYKKILNDRTLFLSINGTIGNVASYNNEKVVLGKSVCYINVNNDYDKNFIKYILYNIDFQNYISKLATGTTIKNVSLKLVREYSFFIPPLDEQKRIASILSALDNKIELNNKTNKILEEMAQTIFKEWFINFNFPNEDGKPYKKSGGEMIDSELGKIPKGWKVITLKDIISIAKGKKPKATSDKITEKFTMPYLTINCYNNEATEYTEYNEKMHVKELDIVMVMDGNAGKIFYGKEGILSSTMAKLIVEDSNLNELVFYFLKSIEYDLMYHTVGSVIQHADKQYMLNKKFCVSLDNLERLSDIFKCIRKEISLNKKENEKLSNIRDSLLPKLMTPKGRRADGEIRV